MGKLICYVLTTVLFIVGGVVAVSFASLNPGYELTSAGYTYTPTASVTQFSHGAYYNLSDGNATITSGNSITTIDSSRFIHLGAGLQVLNSAVALLPSTGLVDIPAKSILTKDASNYVVKPIGQKDFTLPVGSILKVAEKRYVVLDNGTINRNGDPTARRVLAGSLFALHADGAFTIFDDRDVSNSVNASTQLTLDTTACTFDITTEMLSCPDQKPINLAAIIVNPDDNPSITRVSASTPQPSSTPSATTTNTPDSRSPTTGNMTDSTSAKTHQTDRAANSFPDISTLPALRGLPWVTATTTTHGSTITVNGTLSDPRNTVTGLTLRVTDRSGATVAEQALEPTISYSHDGFAVGSTYTIRIVGVYTDGSGTANSVSFYQTTVTVSGLNVSATVSSRTDNALSFAVTATNVSDTLTGVVLAYRENGSNTILGRITVDRDHLLSGTAIAQLTGLHSNSSYVLTVDHYVDGGNTATTTWYTVAQTLRATPSIGSVTASFDKASHTVVVTPVELHDSDNALTQITYSVYAADDFAAHGPAGTVVATTSVSGSAMSGSMSLAQTDAMPNGEYVVVATLHSNDGEKDLIVSSSPSEAFLVDGRHAPSAVFSLDTAASDRLSINYEIVDPDNTIILDGTTHPVIQLFQVDTNGLPVGAPVATRDLLTGADAASGVAEFTGLTKLTTYQARIVASYNIGAGIVSSALIGKSDIYRTTDVDPVTATFTLASADTQSATVTMSLSEQAKNLAALSLQLYSDADYTRTVGNAVDVTKMIEPALADTVPLTFDSLTPNTVYYLKAASATDSGNNAVTVKGSLKFITEKRTPSIDSVTATLKDNTTLAVTPAFRNGSVVDPDLALTKIVYSLFATDDPSTVLATQTVQSSFTDATTFDVTRLEGAGRGRSYVVSARIVWNDNYDDHSLDLSTAAVAVPRSGPSADYEFQSRDASGTTLKVTVTDPDSSIVPGSLVLHDSNGTTFPLSVGANVVTIPGTDAVQVTTTTDYQVLVTDPVVSGAVLQKQSLPAYISVSDTPTAQLSYAGSKTLTLTPSVSSLLASLASYGQYGVTVDGDTKPSTTVTVAGAAATSPSTIQLAAGNLRTDATLSTSIDSTVGYQQNGLSTTALTGKTVALGTLDGKSVTITAQGLAQLGSATTATPFMVTNASYDGSTGTISGLKLTDLLNNKDVTYTSALTEGSSPTAFDLIKRADGSYVLAVTGRYVLFGSSSTSLVADPASATGIQLFTMASAHAVSTSTVAVPALTAPTVSGVTLTPADTSIASNLTVNDPDDTFTVSNGAIVLSLNIYNTATGKIVSQKAITSLGLHNVTINQLTGGTPYTAKIEGSYDLGDGTGVHQTVFYSSDFTTKQTLPTLTNSSLTWDLSCGSTGRSTTEKLSYTDVGKVLTGVKNVWYDKPSSLNLTGMTPAQIASALAPLTPVTQFVSSPSSSLSMPIYSGSTQKYFAGHTYIVVTYFETSVADTPEMLMAANTVSITGPSAPTATISIDSIATKSANVGFTYTDSTNYLTCNSHSFTYTLTDVATGAVMEQGQFTSNTSTGSWGPVAMTGLKPSTNYMLTITTPSDDLTGSGVRPYSVSRTFTTFDELVTSNALTIALNGSALATSVSGLQPGKATIASITMNLVRIDGYGTADQAETVVSQHSLPVPADFPATLSDTFTLTDPGLYYTQMVVSYVANETGIAGSYTANSYPVNYSGATGSLNMSATTHGMMISADDVSAFGTEPVRVALTNDSGAVVADATVSPEELTTGVEVKTDASLAYASVTISRDGTQIAQAVRSDEASYVVARKDKKHWTLVSSAHAGESGTVTFSWKLKGKKQHTTVPIKNLTTGVSAPTGATDYRVRDNNTGTSLRITWPQKKGTTR